MVIAKNQKNPYNSNPLARYFSKFEIFWFIKELFFKKFYVLELFFG